MCQFCHCYKHRHAVSSWNLYLQRKKNLCNALKKFSYYSPFIHASSSLLLMPFGDSVFSSDAVLHRSWNFSAHLIKELSEETIFFQPTSDGSRYLKLGFRVMGICVTVLNYMFSYYISLYAVVASDSFGYHRLVSVLGTTVS